MTVRLPSTRRDFRHRLRRGSSFFEFSDPRANGARATALLVSMSIAGLAFETEGQVADFPEGACFECATVRVGECVLEGDAVIRGVRPIDAQRVEVGCLFYPSAREEDRWMTLMAGIEVAETKGETG